MRFSERPTKRGMLSITLTIIGNGRGNMSSNPERGNCMNLSFHSAMCKCLGKLDILVLVKDTVWIGENLNLNQLYSA